MRTASATPTTERAPVAHPCYDIAHRASAARLHLPVAPRCNMQCRFCDRSFDCVNESRPGVTAALLSPAQALERVDRCRETVPGLAVVGIAGPGDPLANVDETFETFRLVRERHPDLALCLATNGLGLPGRASELVGLGVSHLTVTVNAIDPDVGRRIYSWVRFEGRARSGSAAASLLLERQLRGIEEAACLGLVVKINTILVPGVNEGEVEAIARACAERGASVMNVIPLLPVSGTALEAAGEPTKESVAQARRLAAAYLPQLSHCARCRADAVGFLGADLALTVGAAAATVAKIGAAATADPSWVSAAANASSNSPAAPFLVAVASREGILINRHLGEADRLFIYRIDVTGSFEHVAVRPTPGEGGGQARWEELADLVADCSMVLCTGVGGPPRLILEGRGIKLHVLEGIVGEALETIATGRDLSFMAKRSDCGSGCSGGAKRGCGCA